jgi:hypothetical protein
MKNLLFLFFGLSLISLTAQSNDSQLPNPETGQLRKLTQTAYQTGEKLQYKIGYGLINAGTATLAIKDISTKKGRPAYHVVGTGRSVGMAEWFFRTRDRYETFIDTEALVPWEFIRDVDEGGYLKNHHLIFNQFTQQVKDLKHPEKGTFSYPPYAQDILSALYYARAYNTQNMKAGDTRTFTIFLDHEQFPFQLKLMERKVVKTKFGKIKCLALRPVLQEGRVFEDEESMTIYVSDDANKIPILIESELLVGSIKVELTYYQGLRNPISFF